MAYLEVLEGVDTGKTFPIINEIVLGRGADSDICLPDARASRQHARITHNDTGFVIEDLQSSNGTLLRNNKIFPGTAYDLAHGDHIRIGSTEFVFVATAEESLSGQVPADDDSAPFESEFFEAPPRQTRNPSITTPFHSSPMCTPRRSATGTRRSPCASASMKTPNPQLRCPWMRCPT